VLLYNALHLRKIYRLNGVQDSKVQGVLVFVGRCFPTLCSWREQTTTALGRLSSLEKVPLVLKPGRWSFLFERAKPETFFAFLRLC
jgi:hypothetical protein